MNNELILPTHPDFFGKKLFNPLLLIQGSLRMTQPLPPELFTKVAAFTALKEQIIALNLNSTWFNILRIYFYSNSVEQSLALWQRNQAGVQTFATLAAGLLVAGHREGSKLSSKKDKELIAACLAAVEEFEGPATSLHEVKQRVVVLFGNSLFDGKLAHQILEAHLQLFPDQDVFLDILRIYGEKNSQELKS